MSAPITLLLIPKAAFLRAGQDHGIRSRSPTCPEGAPCKAQGRGATMRTIELNQFLKFPTVASSALT